MAKSNGYDRSFFLEQQTSSRQSAEHVVPAVIECIRPSSVIDVGCGLGAWLAVFRKHGIEDKNLLGVDGDYVDRTLLQIPRDCFQARDLSKPLALHRTFDLAMSLEVAEHLPPERADDFIAELTSLAPVVLFSAAIPHQGGVSHVNEQWQDYWVRIFASHGYEVHDVIRPILWDNRDVLAYYCQNTFLYVKKERLKDYPQITLMDRTLSRNPLPVVHPRIWAGLVYVTHPDHIPLASATRQWIRSLSAAIRRRLPGTQRKI